MTQNHTQSTLAKMQRLVDCLNLMSPARIFEYTFTEAGEYPYFYILHPNMVGTVVVVEGESNSQSTTVGNTTATATRSDDGTIIRNELNLMQ